MSHFLHRAVFLILICSCTGHRVDLTGLWYFDRFGGPHGEISESPEIAEANKLNKGLTITFSNDNKMTSTQGGGTKKIAPR
jgi:hypothetical protein